MGRNYFKIAVSKQRWQKIPINTVTSMLWSCHNVLTHLVNDAITTLPAAQSCLGFLINRLKTCCFCCPPTCLSVVSPVFLSSFLFFPSPSGVSLPHTLSPHLHLFHRPWGLPPKLVILSAYCIEITSRLLFSCFPKLYPLFQYIVLVYACFNWIIFFFLCA